MVERPDRPAGLASPEQGASGISADTHLSPEETELLAALRRHKESAFMTLVARYHNSLVRVAEVYVRSRDVAEEVAQETWLGVLRGLERFEGRSSLKTWIFRILINRARTRARREGRSKTFSAVAGAEAELAESVVGVGCFGERGDHWALPPRDWGENPEAQLLREETRAFLQRAIEALPATQREVITLRDVEGWTSEEVCNVLGLSETNQRVLLHRARSRVRQALEEYLAGTSSRT